MKISKKYAFLDILAKIKERLLDYLFLLYWKIRLYRYICYVTICIQSFIKNKE